MSRSLVSSRLTFAAKAGPFVPVAAEGTTETDWLPEESGFELPVPLRNPRADVGKSSGKVPDAHSVGAIRNHNLGVFTVTEIAMKNTAAVPPAHRLPRTPKAAYPGLRRCRAPSVPLTCLAPLTAWQSLCTGHVNASLEKFCRTGLR